MLMTRQFCESLEKSTTAPKSLLFIPFLHTAAITIVTLIKAGA